MNILEKADEIVNQRSEEKERQYGPFNESMERMRDIFNGMTGLSLTAEHMFDAMIALKLSRIGFAYKEDSYLDAVAYIAAKNNYVNEKV
jgi:DNA-binding protein H-NS